MDDGKGDIGVEEDGWKVSLTELLITLRFLREFSAMDNIGRE